MFIDRGATPPPVPFGGAEGCGSGEALLEFRSAERSWYGSYSPAHKHLTPNRVKTAVELSTFVP